jgi:hypothetical protein
VQALFFALVFTALITPYEIAFLEPKLDALFGINMAVQFVFLVDLGLQFFLHYEESSDLGAVSIGLSIATLLPSL